MRSPFKPKALTASAPAIQAIRDNWNPYPLLGGGSRQRIQEAFNTAKSANYAWIYTNSPAVRTVIDVLVRNMGQLDLRLYEEVNETNRTPKPEHPAALSLRYPSEEVPADQFLRTLIKDFLIFDDAYAVLGNSTNGRITLNWVPAHMVEVGGSSLFRAETYYINKPSGEKVEVPVEAMLHWHGENPHDPRIGLSRLDTLRSLIAEDVALQAAITELATSGMTSPAWVYRPLEAPGWSNEARKGFELDLMNRLRKRNREPVVLEEGMEMRDFGVSPKDAQMSEIRRLTMERVAALYGVPLGMIGLDDNLEEAQAQFYADALPPYCEELTKMLNSRILVRVYDWTDGCFEFNLDEKLMGDERLKTLTAATGRPVMLTNEARAKLNLPPVDIGDELVTPLNVIVGENPKPTTTLNPIQDPNKPPDDGSHREDPPKALLKAVEDPTAGSHEEFEPVPVLHPAYKADLDRQFHNIDLSKAVVERHFARLERALRKKTNRDEDWERWDREFADDIDRLVKHVVSVEGEIYAFKLAGSFDMRKVRNYLRALAEGAAEGINSTIRSEIDDLGLDDALAKRAQHVESAGTSLGANSTRWAREEAARQSPETESRVKVWVPNTQRHARFGGQTVALGDNWPAGFAPGSAPGCHCTMSIH